MKLSKVKKVVLNHGSLCVAAADTGLDVRTWVGCDMGMYPVHELYMTPALAARIWELTGKQIHELHISEETESNGALLITSGDLLRLPMLAEAEGGNPNLYELCRIDGNVILMDQETGTARYFREDILAPTEGRIQYFGEKGSNIVGAYSNGVLEAAIYASRWEANEMLTKKLEKLAEIWGNRTWA